MKQVIHDFTPPILLRGIRRLRRSFAGGVQGFKFAVEQPPEFYDQTYERSDEWRKHYTASHYYPLWTIIADRVRRLEVKRILDIGCGPGQVACLLRDIGVSEYRGLDFSPARVERARIVCPEYEFLVADVFDDNTLDDWNYDCVVLMEFLEHIEQDIDVLLRVRPGTTVLATVPNFPAQGHVRQFDSAKDVQMRYGPILSQLDVAAVLANESGKTYYIVQGNAKSEGDVRDEPST